MHTEKILHKWLSNVLPKMHIKRREALEVVAGAAMRGGKLTVTQMGRSIGGQTKEKHNIKRADRLLSSKHISKEVLEVYRSFCKDFLSTTNRPIIVVDWSAIDSRCNFSVLRAAVAVKGRTLTLYEEVHDITTKETPETHTEFINKLKSIIPSACRPIIVTDAGFRKPWFKAVRDAGWDFVGRIRNINRVKINNHSIISGSLYSQATDIPKHLGTAYLTQRSPIECDLVIYKAKKQPAERKQPRRRNGGRNVTACRKSALEPWLLATSLSNSEAQEIVRIYSTRMQIEESFRDIKSFRYGLSFDSHRTYKKERLIVLLLIGAIATTFAWLLGKASEIGQIHRQFQANTTTTQLVLSFTFIGLQIFRKKFFIITTKLFASAKLALNKNIYSLSYNI